MFQLGDKTRIIFAIIGASCILVSMYLIPLIKTENKFWEILLFILGVLLIGIALLSQKKINFEIVLVSSQSFIASGLELLSFKQ
ncbi:Uncharacterised protein [Streptococcus pneumoniae]|uniref:hypothetical protein n=1 Tax=Streptococcus pneumoniae TaxID=1313 RepID=UPI00016C25C1|nr:hypothetical protein [Streptococcus pneumoniae]CAG5389685.1 Uncharacterised protein [Streptococcus pneumoniae]CAH9177860.1 Uncharacterised protein [Streptococcus pneumoniae]COI24971.1 Uncharacterised protein [Streptococcus pneumoniae]COQ74163.1 Uncharacterised protein [Streptococcus pneumoniae]COS17016.1 Uncharacterised protein [Streptococcus pneumoniae]